MNSIKRQLSIIGFAFVIAIIVFVAFNNAIYVNQTFFIINAIIGISGLTSILISDALTKQNSIAYDCCGNLATIGSSGLILISILAVIIEEYGYIVIVNFILAGNFFFLSLMLTSIWCYLKIRNQCQQNYYC